MPILGCIADDFTGGTDLASNLVKSGFRVVQTIGVPPGPISLEEIDTVVVALKTRTSSAEFAVKESLRAIRWLESLGCTQFYFKYCSTFDSTPAGNIGPVIEALLSNLDEDFTIVCPAFPDNGRTVYQGHLFVHDKLLSESGMQQHPLTPMTDPDIVRVLSRQTVLPVASVRWQTVVQGGPALEASFGALKRRGIAMAVTDALCNDDLRQIASAVRRLRLITGGSGLALGLGENFGIREQSAPTMRIPPGKRVILAGSCSQMTLRQIACFEKTFPSIRLEPSAIATDFDATLQQVLERACEALSTPILVSTSEPPEKLAFSQRRFGSEEAGVLCEKFLSSLAVELAGRGYSQFIVAGGETSGAVVNALGIDHLEIGPEIAPGVPWTLAVGPKRRIALALKSGNFGSERFFLDAWRLIDARI